MCGMATAICGHPMKMPSLRASFTPVVCTSRHRLFRAVSLLASVSAFSVGVYAQNAAADPNDPNARRRRGQNGDANGANNGGRGNFDPSAMMERLREQFGVTDDAEWALISERLTKVSELRRGAMGGGVLGRGGPPGGGAAGGQRPTRGTTGSPESDALRAAITDKMPDAEIKSRLDRLREVRKQNDAKLAKAQEDLRAVLTVRQEAVAVMFGLLP